MNDLESCSFWDKLKPDFQKDTKKLIVQNRSVILYERIKTTCIVFLITTIIFYRKDFINYNINLDALITLGIEMMFLVGIENSYKEPKKKYEKTRETIRNRMIVKICNCKGYCSCKEDLNIYMNSRKIKILSPKKEVEQKSSIQKG